jgi:methylmalonyl-CoA/ethylmalonyl-CoA epimerase
MIQQINHLGIAVKSLEEHIPFYRDTLKLEYKGTEEVADQKVRLAIFVTGGVNIELLEPTSPDSPIARFIEKKGEGLHHVSYQTDDIEAELAGFKAQGLRLIDSSPRGGAHGSKIAFLHPASSGRVLTEITQPGSAS